MANTQKETKHEKLGEKIGRLAVNAGGLLIAIIVSLYLWVIPQPGCGTIDEIYMYCLVHPAGFFDIVGYVLFLFCCVWLSGVWSYLVPYYDDDNPKWRSITILAWIGGVVGCLFMYFL